MAWLKYLAVIGIMGVAHADLICYSATLAECLTDNDMSWNMCITGGSYNILTCMQESAQNCTVDKDKDIVDLVAKTVDMCKPGTKANKDYNTFRPCLFRSSARPPDCAADFRKYQQDLMMKNLTLDKFKKESLKAMCKFAASINNCTVAKVVKECGVDGGNFSLYLQTGPDERINKRFCDLINGVGKNTLNLSVWAVQALILFFTFKFSSY